MQWLVELIAGFVALLAAVALSQLGLNLDTPDKPAREIERVRDCGQTTSMAAATAESAPRDC